MLTITGPAGLTAAGPEQATDPADARVRRGLALPFGPVGRTSAGPVRAAAGGRIGWADDLRRVKVFSDHGRTTPIGYVTALTETDQGVRVELLPTPAARPSCEIAHRVVDRAAHRQQP